MQPPLLSAIILCYRGEDRIHPFVQETLAALEKEIERFELILVANWSDPADKTPQVVEELSHSDSRIRYCAKKKEGMYGWDLRSGMEICRGEYIAYIDGDGQVPFGDFVRVYHAIREDNADMAKTFRTKRNDTVTRKIITVLYNAFFHILFPGVQVRDVNAKPKILKRDVLQKMRLTSDDWFIDAEIMIKAHRLGLRIVEIPTVFHALQGRKSYVTSATIFEFVKNLIRFRISEFSV
ncbi:MAG: hypothetical protein RIQ56_576 [Candidatus Parcubacteria bacterium]|jgi:glycosyltransferase involved in cell wall biosynthesis